MPPLSPEKSQGHSNHTRRGCNEYAKYSEGPTQKWQHGNSKHFQVIGHDSEFTDQHRNVANMGRGLLHFCSDRWMVVFATLPKTINDSDIS